MISLSDMFEDRRSDEVGQAIRALRAPAAWTAEKFARAKSLNQALQNRPSAGFQVVAVSPTRGTAASVQIAQSSARRNAQDVMRSITDMGVPAARLNVASTTDPGATGNEVRVFVR